MAWIAPVRCFVRAGSAPYFAVYIVCNANFAIVISISEAPIPDRIYLDHAATTPIRPEALAAMQEGFKIWANPSSPHAEGRKAKQALEDARERVKKALGWDGEVIFTSGASEALAIGLQRAKVDRRIVSAVEHDAVFRAAPDAEVVPINAAGEIAPDELAQKLDGGATSMVAVQLINSETGANLLPFAKNILLDPVHDVGGLFLSDCSQFAGFHKLPEADMIVISAHKIGGPIGVGALLVKDYAMLQPTGGHERGYRAGTENVPAVLGFAAALEAGGHDSWETSVEQRFAFKDKLYDAGEVVCPGGIASHIFAVAHESLSAQALLIRLDAMGIAVSAGSACSSGTLKKSRVLDAFGIDDDTASRTIRISLGWNTTAEELERFTEAWRSLS